MAEDVATQVGATEDDVLERGGPFRALYEHWERNQWSPLAVDLAADAEAFQELDEDARRGFIWVFSHRFHAEFNVARLLAPFLEHAPSWEMQLLIATQIADEHRHMQSVLRIYDEVFGIGGGIEAAQQVADANLDVVASGCYDKLDEWVGYLAEGGTERDYVMAVLAYHVIAEGVVARTAQHLTADQYSQFGEFRGLVEGQRCVARDEARHIGIGVSYLRRALETNPEVRGWIDWGFEEFGRIAGDLFERSLGANMHDQVIEGYGVEPIAFYEEAVRLTQIRMRSLGCDPEES